MTRSLRGGNGFLARIALSEGMKKFCRFILLGVFGCVGLMACQSNRIDFSLADVESDSLLGLRISHIAFKQLGVPYSFGGTSPNGFDCSGLVQFSYQRVGISVPRTANLQYRRARIIHRAQLRPGDLLFFSLDGGKHVTHVGIYFRNALFIHAPKRGRPVSIEHLDNDYWQSRFVAAGRYQI